MRWVQSEGKQRQHPKFGYISRYNHSAIGEHDRIMWTLGCARYLELHPDRGTDVATLLSGMVQRYVVRDQTLYPSTIEAAAKGRLFHLNDVAFVKAGNHLNGAFIDNPAQLWFTPMYDRRSDKKWKALKEALKTALRDEAVAKHMGNGVERQPIAGECGYIQRYLSYVSAAYNTCPESYIQDWSVMQPRAASIAHVRCKGGRCSVDESTSVDDLIKETAEQKMAKLDDDE